MTSEKTPKLWEVQVLRSIYRHARCGMNIMNNTHT